jgi:coenzyme F420-dependent glucose-6-phosphate dehydrogenase
LLGASTLKIFMNNFKVAYHASHEQFAPSLLLELAVLAERAGFNALHSSDHFQPWSKAQGESGFTFSWIGAAMQATKLPIGMVCAPGQRYHPVMVAQAAATLAEMFPERLWISLGSGEAVNEFFSGEQWPNKANRNARLKECHDVISRLLDGETVNHFGHITVQNAKLYTLPKVKPQFVGAAVTPETAKWLGGWADGLVTINKPIDELQEVIDAFRTGGGAGKPIFLKVQLSYDTDHEKALQGAFEQWKTNIFESSLLSDLTTVSQFEAAAKFVRPEDMYESVHVSANLDEHLEILQRYKAMGFETLILHNVNRNQQGFIQDFAAKVLPQLL